MDMTQSVNSDVILEELYRLSSACEIRCVTDGEQWAQEVLYYLPQEWHERHSSKCDRLFGANPSRTGELEIRCTAFGRALLKTGDFYRAEFFLEKVKDRGACERFLYYWTRYLAFEKRRLENNADGLGLSDFDYSELTSLHAELEEMREQNLDLFDAFLYYVLGKICVSLNLRKNAKEAFVQAVSHSRWFWPAWNELIQLVDSPQDGDTFEAATDDHWMYRLFRAKVLFRFQLPRNALEEYERLSEGGFGSLLFLANEMAACFNALQEHDNAIDFFEKVRKSDPGCLNQMHLYSDSLFVRGLTADLAALAFQFFKTHKYKWETCCIVANYYSLRGNHEQAVKFLQRSLFLNPQNASAWTLIGHEYMEQKNNAAACVAYRKAIAMDPKDHRGWYGLGQLYDILKMHTYALYYYQRAHMCKPEDSRMLVALGEIYVRVKRYDDAQMCFRKAYKVGDVEGNALMLLGGLNAKRGFDDAAALAYEKYLNVYGGESRDDEENISKCCSFLAAYYLKKKDLTTTAVFAQRCLEYEMSKEHGRNILRQVSQAHYRLGGEQLELPGGATSTPSISTAELGIQLRSDAEHMTPILPQITMSACPVVHHLPPFANEQEESSMVIESVEPAVLFREDLANSEDEQ